MLGLPSENDRVAFTSDGVIMASSFSRLQTIAVARGVAHQRQHLAHLGPVQLAVRLAAAQQQVEQVVVGQVHQALQAPRPALA